MAVVRLFLGQRAWVLQRVTAVALLILLTLGAAMLLVGPPLSYERWHALATSTQGAVLILLCFAALCLHGWVGVRDIILDYVHWPAARLAMLALIAMILLAVLIHVLLTMAAQLTMAG